MPLSLGEAKLCKSCKDLLQAPIFKNNSTPHVTSSRNMCDASDVAKEVCRLCAILDASCERAYEVRDNLGDSNSSIFFTSGPDKVHLLIEGTGNALGTQPFQHWRKIPKDAPDYGPLLNSYQDLTSTKFLTEQGLLPIAAKWFWACTSASTSEHQDCGGRRSGIFSPARLLDVRDNRVSLSTRAQRAEQEPYCTLSYCWGTKPISPVLDTYNEATFLDNIDIANLPQTIQDAIFVARDLGVSYLWVDCLCIIQRGDNGEDWRRHAREMTDVYANCVLNISADRASSAWDGFLGERDWPALRPIFAQCRFDEDISRPPVECVLSLMNVADVFLATEPLASRAWVLSERMMSPRTLHFAAGEMFWECTGGFLASKSCPKGFSDQSSNLYSPFSLPQANLGRTHIDEWHRILKHYTSSSLSYASTDKLVALAGVARSVERITGCRFWAGIPDYAFPFGLLWIRRPHAPGTRAPTYRAPSWSWASMDGQVTFVTEAPYDGPLAGPKVNLGFTADVLDVSIEPVEDNNHLGQLRDGSITIRGPVTTLASVRQLFYDKNDTSRSNDTEEEVFEILWDDHTQQGCDDSALVLFLAFLAKSEQPMAMIITPEGTEARWVRVGVLKLYAWLYWTSPRILKKRGEYIQSLEQREVTIW